MTRLDGFQFSGFRSFSSETSVTMAPLQKINLLAGQNNSGKSNILRVISRTYSPVESPSNPWDRPLGDPVHTFSRAEFHTLDSIMEWNSTERYSEQILDFLDNNRVVSDLGKGRGVWVSIADQGRLDENSLFALARAFGDSQMTTDLSRLLTRTYGGGMGQDALRVLKYILASRPTRPTAYTIEGVRAISNESDTDPDLNGRSIKRRLLELQNPSTDRLADRKRFDAIEAFVRSVLDDSSITINIPHDLATIHITQDGKTLPIENMGTGVHEVVILAAAATITQNSILCVEEPEVHLHPILQRKLLRYLQASTTNQYFIATHSAHMLDAAIGSIFHVVREGGVSAVRFAGLARERAQICSELGYRPSDLVQTNAVIWVEGPSDRIYLRHWLEVLSAGEFVEGTHYSIMFYGGALLNSISPLDAEEVEEFISLRNLNRYMVVVMDSDLKDAFVPLNAHKQRVMEELQRDEVTGVAWVTEGYTIENYVPEAMLNSAIEKVHPTVDLDKLPQQHARTNPLASDRLGISQPSKVAIAKNVIMASSAKWPLDLKIRVQSVIELIRRANQNS